MFNSSKLGIAAVALVAAVAVGGFAFAGASPGAQSDDIDYQSAVPVGDDLPAFLDEACQNPGERITRVYDGVGGNGDVTDPVFETIDGVQMTKFITYCVVAGAGGGFVQKEIFFARAGNS